METSHANSALLVLDMQEVLLGSLPGADLLIDATATTIKKARELNIPVIYAVVGFREGFPEISPNSKAFSGIRERFAHITMHQWTKIAEPLKPAANEIVVYKKRYSAFAGNDLEMIFRSQGIQHLILTGVVTSGVILSTFTEAADKDYRLTVLEDCCKDRDEEVHKVLTRKVFPRAGTVLSSLDWIASF